MEPLSKYVEFKNGKKRPDAKGDIPVYGGNGILDYTNESNMERGVVVGRVGVYCGSVFLPKEKCWVSDNAIKAMCYENMDLSYLYYLLSSLRLNERRIGTSQPLLTQTILNNIEVNVPSLTLQKKIAGILVSLDNKIELNNQINDNLEQQTRAIFKEWFIESPESSNWNTGTFSDLVVSTISGDWGKESPTGNNTEKVYCVRGADIPEVKAGNKGKMPTRYILHKNYLAKKLTDGDIVVEISGGSPTQSTGRCTAITQSLLDRYDSGMVCTNFCKAIKPVVGYSMFVYYYWQYLYDKGVFFSYENGTTGIKNLDISGFLETEPIIIAPADKVAAFNDYCICVFNQIFANGKQSEQLVTLRDTLLPRLISGELDVSNIEL